MGAGLKCGFGAVFVASLAVGCGGDEASDDDDGAESATATSTSATSSSGAAASATSATTSSTSGSSGGTASTTGSSTNTATTGGDAPWVCLEVDSGCLCSTIPGSEGETEPCATAYDCCYGLEGSTCYCIETPEENCDELIEVGYERYESCPPP